jgi:hypothetical protein
LHDFADAAGSVSRVLSSVVMIRTPVIPNGWPSAIAPTSSRLGIASNAGVGPSSSMAWA